MSKTPVNTPTEPVESSTRGVSNAEIGNESKEPRPAPKRINVAITPDTVRALEHVMNEEGVTLTEALRRLVGYGDFVYRANKEGKVLVQNNDTIREVVLLS